MGAEEPLPSEGLGACPRENFEIYINADANFSLSKVKILAFSQYTQNNDSINTKFFVKCQRVNNAP